MNTYIPDMKALWMAENVTATLHNIYTLRGAPVRDPLNWSKYIAEALYLFGAGGRGDVRLAPLAALGQRAGPGGPARPARPVRPHEQPGPAPRQPGRDDQPDPQRLRGAEEPAAEVVMPRLPRLARAQRRGVVQRFLGFWDCNPATLIPLSPADSAPLYVEMMGGADEDPGARASSCTTRASTCSPQEILNKLVQAEPQNQAAKDLLADVFEQIGYQQENPGLRNSFLAGGLRAADRHSRGRRRPSRAAPT